MTDDALPQFGFPIAPWFKIFAWWPVDTFDQGTKWLRPVWCRRIQLKPHLDGGALRWWQYRATAPAL